MKRLLDGGVIATTLPEYRIWGTMIQRCENPNAPVYDRYGGRGIKVCPEWRASFVNFYRDMGPRPTPSHSLERKDNDGPYGPDNCKWATKSEQARNTHRAKPLTAFGETKGVADWGEDPRCEVSKSVLKHRIEAGWEIEPALKASVSSSPRPPLPEPSTNRVSPKAGWCDPAKLPKGPNGRALCRRCDQECPKGRRSFCSDACVHEWRLRTDPGYARHCVERRDNGVCAHCGIDTTAMAKRYWRFHHRLVARLRRLHTGWYRDMPRFRHAMARWTKATGFIIDGRGHAWEADHIVPVVEGGGECGLDNYRTLCIGCHKRETAALAARRSGKAISLDSQACLSL